MSGAPELKENLRFVFRLTLILLGSQVASYLGVAALYYSVAIVVGGLRIARRPVEALWVGIVLLAVTSQMYPIGLDELGTSLSGAYRPYILVIATVAIAMVAGQDFRSAKTYNWRRSLSRNVRVRFAVLVAVLFLALASGYYASVTTPGLLDALRECSGWLTLVIFIFLGYGLSLTSAQAKRAFIRLHLSVLVYSGFFLAKFVYISQSLGADQTAAGYGYSQRDMAFFSGLALVLLIGQALTSKVKRDWRTVWPAGFILVFAVLLTGSRSVLLCVLMVTLLFILIRRERTRLRVILLGVAGILAVSVVSSWDFASQDGLIGYVSSRFLVASTEDSSLLSRASEIEAVVEAIRESPILGQGPFFSYSFLDPIVGWKDTTFVDSGLGYLLMKSGLMGTCMFIWFAVDLLKMVRALRTAFPSLIEVVFGSFMFYLVFLPFGPSFFVFQHSWFIGLLVGQSILVGSKFTLSRR
ncbi:MAG: O-antigen ligase family protein, partial [Candidatus Acidiferrum sp.]